MKDIHSFALINKEILENELFFFHSDLQHQSGQNVEPIRSTLTSNEDRIMFK